jgi:peptidoglycan/LPS O-acetylase OafA/YrhL
MSNRESANLDFLRAYAVSTVYFGHLLQTFHIERVVSRVTIYDFAQTGVLIFFVHTSLVLMLSLERLRVSGWRVFEVFYIRRAFRIYPLSVFTVLLMLAVRAPDFPGHPYSWIGWPALLSNLALTQNLTSSVSFPAVLWSLPYEIQMYAVLPALFVLLNHLRCWWTPICLWVLDVVVLVLMWKLKIRGIPFLSSMLQFTPCFLAGIIGYRLWSLAGLNLSFWGWPIVITSCVGIRVLAEAASIPHATTLSAWFACLFLGLAVSQFRELGGGGFEDSRQSPPSTLTGFI